jgi:ABC-2 type transport system ATP-binding protein
MDTRGILRTARDRGAAVFLNSHLLSEVERVCDRVAIVDHGRVVAEGPLVEVLGRRETRIRVGRLPERGLDEALAAFGHVAVDGAELIVVDLDDDRVPDLVSTLVGLDIRVHEVRSGRGSLEERFLELVGRGADPGREAATTAEAAS